MELYASRYKASGGDLRGIDGEGLDMGRGRLFRNGSGDNRSLVEGGSNGLEEFTYEKAER